MPASHHPWTASWQPETADAPSAMATDVGAVNVSGRSTRVDGMRRAHRSLPGLIAVVLIVTACGGSSEGTTTPVPSTTDERTDTNTSESDVTETDAGVVITLTRSAFPEEVAVPSGKTVIWVNSSSSPHEVQIDTHDGSDVDMERIRLDVDGQGEVNLQAGTWTYFCTIHGSMTGTLIVSG